MKQYLDLPDCGCGSAHAAMSAMLTEVNKLAASGHCGIWLTRMAAVLSMAAREMFIRELSEMEGEPKDVIMKAIHMHRAEQLTQLLADQLGPMVVDHYQQLIDAVHGQYSCSEVTKTH